MYRPNTMSDVVSRVQRYAQMGQVLPNYSGTCNFSPDAGYTLPTYGPMLPPGPQPMPGPAPAPQPPMAGNLMNWGSGGFPGYQYGCPPVVAGPPFGPPVYPLGQCAYPGPDGNCFAPPISPIVVQQAPPLQSIVPRCPTDIFLETLGLGDVCIKGCDTKEIIITPPILFKIKRLLLDPSSAYHVSLLQIMIGNWPMNANGKAIPGTAFLPDAIFPILKPLTAMPGIPIVLTFKNHAEHEVCLRGVLVGDGAQ